MSEHWRRSPLSAVWLVLAVLACPASAAHAQSPTTGAVTGMVQSTSAETVREALVTLRDTASGMAQTILTPRSGEFAFRFLTPGNYELFVESIGFAPQRVAGIRVRPEHEVEVISTLESSGGSEAGGIEEFRSAVLAAGRPGSSQWLPEFGIRAFPARERTLVELTRLASTADESNTVEGLPASLSSLVLDGVTFRPAAGPPSLDGRRWTSALALSAAQSAQLVTNGLDIEWSDAAASFLSVHTRAGSERARGEGVGYWSGSTLPDGSSVDAGADSFNDAQGALMLRGPIMADRARFTIGLEARHLETPLSSAWADTEAAATLVDAGSSAGLDLRQFAQPGLTRHRSLSAFARLDGIVSGTHQFELSSHFVTTPASDRMLAGSGARLDGSDLLLGGNVRSALGSGRDNELRVSVTRTERDAPGADSVPHTMVAADALRFGAESSTYSAAETLIRVSDAVHYRTGSHALKVGVGFTLGSYRYDNPPPARGSYAFGSVDELVAGTGAFTRIEGPAAFADWSNRTVSVFAQDRWSAGEGLDVVMGVRADRETLPSDVRRDPDWFQLTGLANDEVGSASWRIAPRIGMTWDVGHTHDWIVQASGGLYYDRFDPLLLAEWQTDDGTNRVRRVAGTVAWPQIESAAGSTAPRLTMLAENFDAPRTARVSGGVTRRLGRTAVHIGGVFRRTENLPRRTDLNLLQLPAFRDQNGRAVYGALIKQGGLLTSSPGTSRRFTEYDEVAALSADGWSEHFGITVGAERDLTDAVGLLARYTYGRTTDNWYDAAHSGWATSSPAGLEGDWSEGTSDFDRPHRAVAGVVLDVFDAVRLAGLYRLQSGLPFTPGFRPGVDANADDVPGNDPAFVDPAIPGMDALVREWPCLRASSGRFAERNSCRTDPMHALDLSLSVRVLRLGSASTSLVADVFDVLESMEKRPDTALYLVDAAADLVTDVAARTVMVPLLPNPEFGEPLVSRHSGRRIRLGISLNW